MWISIKVDWYCKMDGEQRMDNLSGSRRGERTFATNCPSDVI